MNLDDLGQHHRTLLKRLIRSNPDEKFGEIVESMLESSDRMSQLRNVRSNIEYWCREYLDVIEDTTKVDKK
jgi:hypothetical protein